MLKIAASLLLLSGALHAAPVLYTFTGAFSTGLGPVAAGSTFSGSAIFDPNQLGANPLTPDYAIVSSFTFSMPSAGFAISSIPNPSFLFGGAHFNGSTFDNFQFNLRSTVDNNIYPFFLALVSGPGRAAMTTADFAQNIMATSYTITGPTAVPEPAYFAGVALALVSMAAMRQLRLLRAS